MRKLVLLASVASLLAAGIVPTSAKGWKIPKWAQVTIKSGTDLIPYCWGAPQDCRGGPDNGGAAMSSNPSVPTQYYAGLRVDCVDTQTGRPDGDSTLQVFSLVSVADAEARAMDIYNNSQICQRGGDRSRKDYGNPRYTHRL